MNTLSIIGYVLIVLGSLLMAINKNILSNKFKLLHKIIGALVLLGGMILSGYENVQILNKVEEFRQEIKLILSDSYNENRAEAISKINNNFENWAKDFIKNKELKRIEFNKSEISYKEKILTLNNKWNNFYSYAFNCIANIVEAYNNNSDKKIEFYSSSKIFPANIYSKEAKEYYTYIKFRNEFYWKINLQISDPIKHERIPNIVIVVTPDLNEYGSDNGIIIIVPMVYKDELRIEVAGENFKSFPFKEYYATNDYKTTISNLIKSLFEYQLLKLDNNQ